MDTQETSRDDGGPYGEKVGEKRAADQVEKEPNQQGNGLIPKRVKPNVAVVVQPPVNQFDMALSQLREVHGQELHTAYARIYNLEKRIEVLQQLLPDKQESKVVTEQRGNVVSYEELSKKYKEVCDDNKRLKDDRDTLCEDVAYLQSYRPRETPDEEEIMQLWRMLEAFVKNLVHQNFSGQPLKTTVAGDREFFARLTPKADELLKYGSTKEIVIQAAIWRMLADSLLDTPCAVYHEQTGETIRSVERANRSKWS